MKKLMLGIMMMVLMFMPALGFTADQSASEELTIAWEQGAEDLPYLNGWTIYVSATPGAGYVKLLDVPYTTGAGPTFTAETVLTVTGAPGSTVNRYIVATSRNTVGVESGYSNEAIIAFEIPIPSIGAPFNLIIKFKVN